MLGFHRKNILVFQRTFYWTVQSVKNILKITFLNNIFKEHHKEPLVTLYLKLLCIKHY